MNDVLKIFGRSLMHDVCFVLLKVAKYYLGGQAAWGQPPEGNVAYVDLSAVSKHIRTCARACFLNVRHIIEVFSFSRSFTPVQMFFAFLVRWLWFLGGDSVMFSGKRSSRHHALALCCTHGD